MSLKGVKFIKNNFLKIELYRVIVLYSGYKVPITYTQKEISKAILSFASTKKYKISEHGANLRFLKGKQNKPELEWVHT